MNTNAEELFTLEETISLDMQKIYEKFLRSLPHHFHEILKKKLGKKYAETLHIEFWNNDDVNRTIFRIKNHVTSLRICIYSYDSARKPVIRYFTEGDSSDPHTTEGLSVSDIFSDATVDGCVRWLIKGELPHCLKSS